MIFCDIGNTSYHFLDDNKEYKKPTNIFDPSTIKTTIYYISVNPIIQERLKQLSNWINLEDKVDKTPYYSTMGIDRIVASLCVDDVVIVDAGSAITVDVVKGGVYKGGFIYAGVKAMNETYKHISSKLNYRFNFDVDLENLPKNSQDAISYGYLKTLYNEVISYNLDIILTGGDAKLLAKIFPTATIDGRLIFKGMATIQ